MDKLTVFLARTIRTMDLGRPIANAVAVAEGKVVSVGDLESMKPWLDRYPHEIDDTFADKVFVLVLLTPTPTSDSLEPVWGLSMWGPSIQRIQ